MSEFDFIKAFAGVDLLELEVGLSSLDRHLALTDVVPEDEQRRRDVVDGRWRHPR